uniref:Uncharacterized protein n=1 Tax=Rhizophora mucronata TaxID=61149 RepID=A0A2P2P3D8_RHIMU
MVLESSKPKCFWLFVINENQVVGFGKRKK